MAGITARILGTTLVCAVIPTGSVVPERTIIRSLHAVVMEGMDKGASDLGVVPIPDNPLPWVAKPARFAEGCPVDVRAIIRGDEPSSDFAIVAWPDGNGLLGVGEGMRTPHGWYAVSSIESDHIVLRHGSETYWCALGAAVKTADRDFSTGP